MAPTHEPEQSPGEQPTPEDFKALMKRHSLTRLGVSELAHVSLSAVDSWTAPAGSIKSRSIPPGCWELLLLKLDEHPLKVLVDR